ncbi:hypothetical protein DC522_06925 [Microvirga sp. KLBC 81]|uniref:hypothetical protein n=1 Tax=Microvirga sp. KLBC 81 TaxID=1862707 RepID=UPI000D51BA54|nr:hypothetical protein [Microvirga sp. KLBC 81]PVE25255.1 hypothetical protein DC522_06925 [Microvirga sp. KLBC 81]
MVYEKALQIAGRRLVDGATLAELKQASKDLRAMTPDSALADLVDAKIKLIESRQGTSRIP